jgi:hypothetical protein
MGAGLRAGHHQEIGVEVFRAVAVGLGAHLSGSVGVVDGVKITDW